MSTSVNPLLTVIPANPSQVSAPPPSVAAPAVSAPSVPASPAAPSTPGGLTFGQKLHAALMANPLSSKGPLASIAIAAVDALKKPGVQSVIGGVNDALADASHATDNLKPGQGWLTGIENVAAARQARIAAQQAADQKTEQQDFENAQTAAHDKALNDYTVAQTVSLQRQAAYADAEGQQKLIASGKLAAQGFDQDHDLISSDITEDQLKADYQNNVFDKNNVTAFQTGSTKVLKGGQMVDEPTFSIYNNKNKTITISPEQAAFITKWGGQDVPAGSQLDAKVFDSLWTRSQTAQTTAHLISQSDMQTSQDQLDQMHRDDLATVAPYVGSHMGQFNNDSIATLSNLAKETQPKTVNGKPVVDPKTKKPVMESTKEAVAAQRILASYDQKDLMQHYHDEIMAQHDQREDARKAEEEGANDAVDAALALSDTPDKNGVSPRAAALAKVPLKQRTIAIKSAQTEAAEAIAALKVDPNNQDAKDNLADAQARMAALQPRPPKSNNNNPPVTQPATAEQQVRNDQAVQDFKNTQSAAENRAGVEGALGTIIGNPALGANKSNLIDPDTYIKQHPDLDSGQQQAIRNFANPPAMVTVKLPNGRVGQIPPSQLQKFLQENPGSSQVQ